MIRPALLTVVCWLVPFLCGAKPNLVLFYADDLGYTDLSCQGSDLQSYGKDLGSPFAHFRTTPCSVVRHGDWKLIEYFEDGALELYNLPNDAREQTNLATTHPERRDQLRRLLINWRAGVNAPVPTQRNPEFRE